MGFHDYVASTWVWRDPNFENITYAWKKDLFNILYGTMPMWHMTKEIWQQHKDTIIKSYKKIQAIRYEIGFAEMRSFGWLTDDKSVQYSDWDTGHRIIVNFGEKVYKGKDRLEVAPRSYVITK